MPEFIIEIGGKIQRRNIEKQEIGLGRDAENDIVLDDHEASRRHCVIRKGSAGWYVQDLNSANGTFVHEERVVRAAIARGDVIKIGSASLTFLAEEEPADVAAVGSEGEGTPPPPAPEIEGARSVAYLGSGLLSRTWSYRHDDTGAIHAYRIVKPEWADDPAFRKWFDAAMDACRGVDHPLVSVPARIDSGNAIRLRERVADQGTLRSRLETGRIDLREGLDILIALTKAVAAMHDVGVVHGGIRPSKIRFSSDGPPRLATPGLPWALLDHVLDDAVGELSCLPPESLAPGADRATVAGDIWSIGAVAHRVLLNAPIGEGRTKIAMTQSIQKGLRKPPKERRPELSQGLADLITACLSIDPAGRPRSARAVLTALESETVIVKAKPKGDIKALEARPRELGERPEPPKRSARFRALSMAVSAAIFVGLNSLVYLSFTYNLVTIPSCRGGNGSVAEPEDEEVATPVAPKRRDESANDPVTVAPVDEAELARRVHQRLVDDLYQEALAMVEELRAKGRITAEAAADRSADIEKKMAVRKAELLAEVRAALDRGDGNAARPSIDRLENVVGAGDAEFTAVFEAWKALK